MKKFVFIIAIVFTTAHSIDAQWISQTSNVTGKLSDVCFINENTGWICGDDCVLKTTNSGVNWQKINISGSNNSIQFINSETGYIAGNNGKLYKTINSGVNWELVNLGITTNLNQIRFFNSSFGIVVGNKAKAFKTTNGGLNWSNISISGDTLDILDLKILSENKIIFTGTESTVWTSINAGVTWSSIWFGMPNPLFAIDFINENTGMVSGCCGMLMRTTNSGINWTPEVYLTPGFTVHSLKYVTPNKVFIAAEAGYIFRTSNNGMNWDSLVVPNHNDIHGMHFVNENTGWLVGIWGTILKTTNGGGTGFPIGINQISSNIPEKFFLSQNYPNPFNPVTKIVFDIPSNVKSQMSNVKLYVYDINGKLVETLLNQNLSTGTYEITWDASNFPSGIYFYTLNSDMFSQTKKMILIK
ncbi:MAG TPA: YCF48-related protein [Ignavibacteria bacterium]|nr:YCF48-related protein [Ignavibacteria bacterium]